MREDVIITHQPQAPGPGVGDGGHEDARADAGPDAHVDRQPPGQRGGDNEGQHAEDSQPVIPDHGTEEEPLRARQLEAAVHAARPQSQPVDEELASAAVGAAAEQPAQDDLRAGNGFGVHDSRGCSGR